MERFAATLCLSGAFLFALGNPGFAQQVDSEELLGGHENPPVISDGTGDFTAQLDVNPADPVAPIPFQLTYDVGAEGSAPDQAHLHIANPSNNGGIVVFLCSNLGNTPVGATVRECPPSPGRVDAEIVAGDVLAVAEGEPPAAIPIIAAGDLAGLKLLIDQGAVYANVHTPAHATGEIRGQLESQSLLPARRR
jgi:CHRD domain